jgi:hypothetical protein
MVERVGRAEGAGALKSETAGGVGGAEMTPPPYSFLPPPPLPPLPPAPPTFPPPEAITISLRFKVQK